MFEYLGNFVYRMRYATIAVVVILMGGLGLYGLDLAKHLSQSGWFDPTSESVKGSQLADKNFGRDHKSDVIVLITPPKGTLVNDPIFGTKVEKIIVDLTTKFPNIVDRDSEVAGIYDPWEDGVDPQILSQIRARLFDKTLEHAFVSIGIKGDDDTKILKSYKEIQPFFTDLDKKYDLPGTKFEVTGLQPIASAMADGMENDIKRAEFIALPVVALMLFIIFGGAVAASLPVIIGGLTIAGSLGIMKILAQITELNIFAQSVVTLIGLGIAIDYGLFMVSRFREELAEGYSTKDSVRRTVMTSGQTVVFSATIIVAALACLLLFPQGFLKSVAYGAIFSVSLAALISVTMLPAMLSILGPRIDMLGFTFLRRTKSKKEIENGFWGKLSSWVMDNPLKTAIPTVFILLALIIPFAGIKFGGLSEKLLPPENPNRVAQQHFDDIFPTERTEVVKLVVKYKEEDENADAKLASIAEQANATKWFTKKFDATNTDESSEEVDKNGYFYVQMSAGLYDMQTADKAVKELRKIDTQGLEMWVAGTPALTQDTISALLKDLPLMVLLLVTVTGILMFLAFGSVILPIKASLVSALGLGSTLGILTLIFIDGYGSGIADFTPGPLFSPVLVLIIAIVFGLSTDYEVFLLSRMVEARAKGASTTDSVRLGTAYTGRIITAAAAILVVVTGAFGLSEIVMMKYIAFGMIAALILDATIIRMLLVPAVMKMLGDDCWWAPNFAKKLQEKIGLGETILDDELQSPTKLAARQSLSSGKPSSSTALANAQTVTFPAAVIIETEKNPATRPGAWSPQRASESRREQRRKAQLLEPETTVLETVSPETLETVSPEAKDSAEPKTQHIPTRQLGQDANQLSVRDLLRRKKNSD